MRVVRHCEYKRHNELRDYEPVASLMVYSFIEMVLVNNEKYRNKYYL